MCEVIAPLLPAAWSVRFAAMPSRPGAPGPAAEADSATWRRVASRIAASETAILYFTDGAASDNGKPTCRAASAVIVVLPDGLGFVASGPAIQRLDGGVSNVRAEFTALLVAAKIRRHFGADRAAVIVTDYKPGILTIVDWYPRWCREAALDDKSNLDLIEAVYSEVTAALAPGAGLPAPNGGPAAPLAELRGPPGASAAGGGAAAAVVWHHCHSHRKMPAEPVDAALWYGNFCADSEAGAANRR